MKILLNNKSGMVLVSQYIMYVFRKGKKENGKRKSGIECTKFSLARSGKNDGNSLSFFFWVKGKKYQSEQ